MLIGFLLAFYQAEEAECEESDKGLLYGQREHAPRLKYSADVPVPIPMSSSNSIPIPASISVPIPSSISVPSAHAIF